MCRVQGELGQALKTLPAAANLPLVDISGLVNALPCPTVGTLIEGLRAGAYGPSGEEAWALNSPLLRQQLLGSFNAAAVCHLAQVRTSRARTASSSC